MEMDIDHVSKKLTSAERSLTAWGLFRNLAWEKEDNKLGRTCQGSMMDYGRSDIAGTDPLDFEYAVFRADRQRFGFIVVGSQLHAP